MTAGKRISRRTFIRLEDIEGQSENRHWDRIEIMPNTPPNTSTRYTLRCALLYKRYH